MKKSDLLPGIHALRVVAAATVYLLHAINLTADFGPRAVAFANQLTFGVPLFFAVSAFSLMYSTRLYQGTPGWIARFYLKRYFRIAPLFYFMLIVSVGLVTSMSLGKYIPQRPFPEWGEFLLNLTFTFGLSPRDVSSLVLIGWSVGTEMLFYLIFPLVLVGVRGIGSALAFVIASVVVGEIARPILDPIAPQAFFTTLSDYHILTNLRYFAFGVLAFHIFTKLRETQLAKPDARWLPVSAFHLLCGTASAALAVAVVVFTPQLEQIYHLDTVVWGTLFLVMCVWWGLRPFGLLAWAPVQYLGERSYSLYLVHFPVILLMAPLIQRASETLAPAIGGWTVPIVVGGAYLPVVAVSALTYKLFEAPGMELGRVLSRRIGRRERAIAAAAVE
jgi:peptidoglycan/LPS O-acetylase OafA/YrhL